MAADRATNLPAIRMRVFRKNGRAVREVIRCQLTTCWSIRPKLPMDRRPLGGNPVMQLGGKLIFRCEP
jgi:hypothetical protein